LIFAVSVPPFPSLIVYGMTTSPVNPGFGVNVIVPSGFNVAVHHGIVTVLPGITVTPLISVIVRGFPSGSVSLPSGLMIIGVSAIVDHVSLLATGGLLG